MIDFRPITADMKEVYESCLCGVPERGCEYSFANLSIWGEQSISYIGGCAVIISRYGNHTSYPFPIGSGDLRKAVDAVIADSAERGTECRFTGVTLTDKAFLEREYPEKFAYTCDRNFFDYVYETKALAELSGRKYHSKKNHFNKFKKMFPDFVTEIICEENETDVRNMIDTWYADRAVQSPNADFESEKAALRKAFDLRAELGTEGIILRDGEKILAMTLASRLSDNTYDVHFEKALHGADGAYAAVNREFAEYMRREHPKIEFLNREDDMGLDGLRTAKESYRPHHMVEKWRAVYREEP